ncbi:ATP-binding protein [Vibrio alfacsensis]|uniref:ATP-binding protein n=2 Tax=Vibrio alfacsensis TaxID=1074311 RepID=A0ABN5PI99_9VIBR|nr:ATP-binding protein [Vibrio alfacsensis]
MVEMEITIVENGRPAVVRNDEDLEKVGSEGISKLAIIVVFCGMTRFLCQDEDVAIHWPLDELGKFLFLT